MSGTVCLFAFCYIFAHNKAESQKKDNVVSKGGYTLFVIVYLVNKNPGSEHDGMMTLLEAIRDTYCVKTAQY